MGPYGDVQARFSTLDLTAGAHTLEAIVDPDLQVKELELNDKPRTISIQVTCAKGADAPLPKPTGIDLQIATLEVKKPDGQTGCRVGENSVGVKIANVGDKDPGVFSVQLKVDDKVRDTTTVGGVAPNTDKQAFFSGVEFSEGSHTVQVTLDPDKKIPETDENDNSSSIKVSCK